MKVTKFSEHLLKENVECKIDSSVLQRVVDEWWNTWHRFHDEYDLPPKHINDILLELSKSGIEFDIMDGRWK